MSRKLGTVFSLLLLLTPGEGDRCNPAAAPAADLRASADALYAAQDLGAAAEAYRALVETQPEDPELRIRLADCLTRTDRFVEAIEQGRAAVRLSGGSAGALAILGLAHHREGDFDAARERLREGLEQDPECGRCLWGLARIQAIHGDYAGAAESFQRAAALEPENPVFLRHLASYVSDREAQKTLYRRYLELPRAEEEAIWENARAWLAMLEYAGDRPLKVAEIPEEGAEVPLVPQGSMSYVTVTLGSSRRKLRYLFDTGASGFTVPGGMVRKLGLEEIDGYTITGIGGAGTSETRMVLIDEVRAGDVAVRNVPAVVSDSIPGIDGLLGPTLFGGAPTRLDQVHRRLRIGKAAEATGEASSADEQPARRRRPAGEPVEIPFLSINGTPFLPVDVDGVTMNAMVDTGGSQAVLSVHAASQVPDLQLLAPGLTPPAYQEIRGSTGTRQDVRVARQATLRFAGRTLEMGAHVPDPARILVSYDLTSLSHGMGTEVWAILGNPQLEDFALTIDWGRQVLRLEPLR